MIYVFGLGNPGLKYKKTRHNAGFMLVDALAGEMGARFKANAKFDAKVAEGALGGERVTLVKPQTFMNNSGWTVGAVVDYYKLDLADILVAYDDVDLPLGALRLRTRGSAGTHNGMRSVVTCLCSEDFPRLRLGIGAPEGQKGMIGHVLGRFSPEEAEAMEDMIARAVACVRCIALEGVAGAQSKYNGK